MVVEEAEERRGGWGLLGLWETSDGSLFVPVPGTNIVVL